MSGQVGHPLRCEEGLTHDRVTEALDYDPRTGAFVWRIHNGNKVYPGKPAGGGCRYVRIMLDGRGVFAHRLAFFYMNGKWPRLVDHVDGDKLNNRWANLRPATKSQNAINSKVRKDNKSGIRGVDWYARVGKWRATIRVDGQQMHLGSFGTKEEAAAAYTAASEKHHGEFRRVG